MIKATGDDELYARGWQGRFYDDQDLIVDYMERKGSMSNHKYVMVDEYEHGIIVMPDGISQEDEEGISLNYPSRGETAVTIEEARRIAAELLAAASEMAELGEDKAA
jgi:hypothetical protein